MKPFKNVHLGGLWLNIGWYRGEPFNLFKLSILESFHGGLTFFDLTITKLMLRFGIDF